MAPLDWEEWARWHAQAQHTLASGKQDLEEGDYGWASFKAHQAGEYALKGLLRGLGRPACGYALIRLLQALKEAGHEVPEALEEKARTLYPFLLFCSLSPNGMTPTGGPFRGPHPGASQGGVVLERFLLLQGLNPGRVEAKGLTPEEFAKAMAKGALWWLEGALEL